MSFTLPQLDAEGHSVGGASPVERAAAIVAAAQAKADQIAAEAAAAGRAEGIAAGREEARKEVDVALAGLELAARDVLEAREELATLAEQRAAQLAVLIAEKIVGAALDVSPELVLDTCAAVLRRTIRRDGLVLEVHPDDLEIVREGLTELAARLGDLGRVEAVGERRIVRGGCILRTSEGEIDATLAAQLERARDVIATALRA